MKKYVKPELYYENFELSQHIAACGIDVKNSTSQYDCAQLDPDFWGGMSGRVFDSANSCTLDIRAIEVYCYTAGTSEAGKLFNS